MTAFQALVRMVVLVLTKLTHIPASALLDTMEKTVGQVMYMLK